MKILYVDLSPGVGGSLVSLERLLPRLDRGEVVSLVLLAAGNPAVSRFGALGIPTITVATFRADDARSTALVQHVKRTALPSHVRSRGLVGRLWVAARTLRNVLTRTLPLTWRLYRVMRAVRPDLVHVNDAVFVNRAVIAAAWLARIPAICHVRSLGPLTAWDRWWARTLRGLIYISRWVAGDFAAQMADPRFGIVETDGGSNPTGHDLANRPLVRIVYDGLDASSYANAPDRRAARDALGLPLDRPIVAVLGRLVPWKGQDLFLRAMALVREQIPDVLGLVAGEAESFSRAFEPALRGLVQELGLGNTVQFTGFVQDSRVLLAAIDLLAHTSVSPEPFGLVVLEAMAAGRPVVTPAEGGGPEMVVDGVTGGLYAPRDPVALATSIVQILSNPEACSAMGQAGYRRVIGQFSLDRFAGDMARFYRDLAGTQREPNKSPAAVN